MSQLPLAEIRRLQTVQHIIIIIIVVTMVHWSQCSDRSHAHLLTPLITDTSEHIGFFCFLVFSVFHFLLVGSVR